MRLKTIHLACAAALAAAPAAASASILFSDDFNTAGSAANYTLAQTGQNQVTWAWDYSTMGIPSAPNTTDGSTLGVKFESNMTAVSRAGDPWPARHRSGGAGFKRSWGDVSGRPHHRGRPLLFCHCQFARITPARNPIR
jgi:predicted porin